MTFRKGRVASLTANDSIHIVLSAQDLRLIDREKLSQLRLRRFDRKKFFVLFWNPVERSPYFAPDNASGSLTAGKISYCGKNQLANAAMSRMSVKRTMSKNGLRRGRSENFSQFLLDQILVCAFDLGAGISQLQQATKS